MPDNALSKNALSPSAVSAGAVSPSAVSASAVSAGAGPGNSLSARDHLSLERLKLATDVLLSNHDDIPDTLEESSPSSASASSTPYSHPELSLGAKAMPR